MPVEFGIVVRSNGDWDVVGQGSLVAVADNMRVQLLVLMAAALWSLCEMLFYPISICLSNLASQHLSWPIRLSLHHVAFAWQRQQDLSWLNIELSLEATFVAV